MEKDPVSREIPKSSFKLPRHRDFTFRPDRVIHHIYSLDPTTQCGHSWGARGLRLGRRV